MTESTKFKTDLCSRPEREGRAERHSREDAMHQLFACDASPSPQEKRANVCPPPLVSLEKDFFDRTRMPRHSHWAVVWSDLMMTMFILFVVLYVYATAQKDFLGQEGLGNYQGPSSLDTRVLETAGSSLGEAGGPSEGFIDKMYDLSKQALSDEALNEFASVELVPEQTVRIILTGDLLFASGQAMVRPEAERSLGAVAQLLQKTPYIINVIGHTDDQPIATALYPSNWELSSARASAVARYLIDEMNIPASQFYVTGHGAFRPVRPNDSLKNRAKNRRVLIVITKEKPGATIALGQKQSTTERRL